MDAGRISRHTAPLALMTLAACAVPSLRPAPTAFSPAPIPIAAESVTLAAYYGEIETSLRGNDMLRTDGGAGAPFTAEQLARDFVRIALFDEYAGGDIARAQNTLSPLRRWDVPVRIGMEFGQTVPAELRAKATAEVRDFAGRLGALTGQRVTLSPRAPNLYVLVLNEPDRHGYEARLRELVPGISDAAVSTFVNLPRSQFCAVMAFSDQGEAGYARAVAIIRGEHPDLMRQACINEELSQAMGLANDSPVARPSIFNDDEEYATLTYHDELLLRMLYDPRFTTGMSAAEAAPIARRIAAELMAPAT